MPTTTARAAKMPKKETEKYRRLLQEKKNTLLAELAKTKNAEEETTEESTQDIADKAVSSYTREFLYSLNDSERNTIQQIDQALVPHRGRNLRLLSELRQPDEREAPDRHPLVPPLRGLPGARREGTPGSLETVAIERGPGHPGPFRF